MSQLSVVRWEGRAEQKVRQDLRPLFERELEAVFGNATVPQLTVYDCFAGYGGDQEQKVVLGVEVRAGDAFDSHIVKLGAAADVRCDAEGWRNCAAARYIGSRIFVRVRKINLPPQGDSPRAAVIYENAYILFGLDQKTQSPEFLEDVATWAVLDDKPDPASVERVICQIYGDLHRWFYRTARPNPAVAADFYRRRLEKAIPKWSSRDAADPMQRSEVEGRTVLRRDAVWLLCGRDLPDSTQPAVYLDPYDYVHWALWDAQPQHVPPTLIGCSHGDLHGRNVLVGVRRGEAEFPVVYDYGDMSPTNVLVWDFVKLEVELKTRLLPKLYQDKEARRLLLDRRGDQPPRDNVPQEKLDDEERFRAERARRMAFMFEFESLLTEGTNLILGRQDAEARRPPGERLTYSESEKVNRAVRILLRIRQEAALWLGYEQPGRHSQWREEYDFALAVYGLATAKWNNYEAQQSECALISAGTAAARLQAARRVIYEQQTQPAAPEGPFPSYRVPLFHAHRRWEAGDTEGALRSIERARIDFEHPVPVLQEYALILAERKRLQEAREVIEPLHAMCLVFGDFETLTRIGRAFKNEGDSEWQRDNLPGLPDGTAKQYFMRAHEFYQEAFRLSGNYFPGVNAATLARLVGRDPEAIECAESVLAICERVRIGEGKDELYWVFVSEGEAMLATDRPDRAAQAAKYYGSALRTLTEQQAGMAQSTWNQLCRLWRAFGAELVEPSVRVFEQHPVWNQLSPGPLGDCGRVRPERRLATGGAMV